jgi:hypothetical protein
MQRESGRCHSLHIRQPNPGQKLQVVCMETASASPDIDRLQLMQFSKNEDFDVYPRDPVSVRLDCMSNNSYHRIFLPS